MPRTDWRRCFIVDGAFDKYAEIHAIIRRHSTDEHVWKTIFPSKCNELMVGRTRAVARDLHLHRWHEIRFIFDVDICVTYEKDIRRGRGLPIVIGVIEEFTDSVGIENTVVKFIVDVLDIHNFGAESLLRAIVSKRLNVLNKVVMCNNNIVCGVVRAAQIGWGIHRDFGFRN